MQIGKTDSRTGNAHDVGIQLVGVTQLELFTVGVIEIDQDDVGFLSRANPGKARQQNCRQRYQQSKPGFDVHDLAKVVGSGLCG